MGEMQRDLDRLAAGFKVDTDALRSALAEPGPEEGGESSYLAELRSTNFEALDPTASAQMLLQLRSRLMTGGS
jgi:hypothetical protein